ncbi:MAG: hypothetical protein AAGD35_15775 [Actinomycetota bacterium]
MLAGVHGAPRTSDRGRSRRLRGSSLRRAVVGVAVLALAGTACTTQGDAGPSPTLGSELADLAAGAESTTEPTADAPWAAPTPGGAELSEAATAAEIRAAVAEAHGRTLDVSAEMRRFAPFPQLPEQQRAELHELRAEVREADGGAGLVVVAEVRYTVDGAADALIDQYVADFAARGWLQVAARTSVSDGGAAREFDFEIPETPYRLPDVGLTVAPTPAFDSVSRSSITVRYTETRPADDPLANRYRAWTAAVPLPPGFSVTGAGIHTSSIGASTLHYSVAMFYPGIGANEVATAVRSALPISGFEEDPTRISRDETDDWVHMRNPEFDKTWISTQNGGDVPTAATPTRVTVNARVTFEPAAT